jgi:light-regulated signal transduction histidine kinase (bacteriophytochrome)
MSNSIGAYVLAMVRDVTERRKREHRLAESNERLEQFAYAASHDLQEPLRMVSSYLQLLERRYGDDLDADAGEFLAYAVDGADRMRAMIDGLLEYSRIESGGEPLEPVELEPLLWQVLDNLQLRIEERNAEIVVAGTLPRVQGDSTQLRQLFQNVLDNAIEYGGDSPRVRVTAERDSSMWRLSVRDDGIGIAREDRERVFDIFQRLHTRDEHAGTGIGLALCKRIVERHGGEIWIGGGSDEETEISFTLPAVTDAE